jgi:uncharacterized OsmC-like protein
VAEADVTATGIHNQRAEITRRPDTTVPKGTVATQPEKARINVMTAMKMKTPTKTVDNGVNVTALLGAREALEKAPEAAQFKWRASCDWLNGTHSRSAIGGFFGLGGEQSRGKVFTVEADHPKVFAAQDNAPTPVELVLSGLASCLTAGVAAVAQRRGIQLHSVKASLEADMDLYGILGIDEDVRNGFGTIRVHFDIMADATEEEIKALVAQSQKRSAVFDIITNPTNVHVSVSRK